MRLFDLKGKTILITGGYGYLGSALSSGLADFDATVCVLGRSQEKFDEAFKPGKGNIDFIDCDISDTKSIKSAIIDATDKHGSIDVLINNAVYCRGNDPLNISDDDWAYSIDGVLASAYRCIREAVPYFQRQKSGVIINVASMYGVVVPDFSAYENAPGFLNPPHYGAAKAALIHLTRYFSRYLGPWNIRVNGISPGPFPNPETQKNQAFIDALEKRTSLGRIGKPEELVGAIVYLSSSASAYVTGQNLTIDGGWTVG